MTEIRDELWLRYPNGFLAAPGNFAITKCEWTLEENAFHVLRASGPLVNDAVAPEDILDTRMLMLDARFEIHRFIDGRLLGIEGDTQFFLRAWAFGDNDDKTSSWEIEAYSPEYFLMGRIIDSYASVDGAVNPLTTKSGPGDDLIKAFVNENGGAGTSTAARIMAELSIDPSLSLAPSTDKSAAWGQVFETLNNLCEDAAARGTYLSWGLVASGNGTGFTLRTWTGQRGVDHTAGSGDRVVISKAHKNLQSGKIIHDHRQEVTAVRALGKGEGAARLNVRVEDMARSLASPWAYMEAKEETQAETLDTLTTEANAALQRGRAVKGFTGKFQDADYSRYGDRVKFGDLVTAECQGESFDCRLSRVKGSWGDGLADTIDIDLNGSTPL